MRTLAARLALGSLLLLAPAASDAQPATRAAFLDRDGVVRWRDDNEEVALFGANYTLPSASDYRAAGYVTRDRKRLVDDDVAHFARMGWTGVRVALWGDWENSDRAGNLLVNEHLDLADYLVAKARARGIYVLLSPIQTYDAGWPDALRDTTRPGFARHFPKGELGTNPAAIAAQARYVRQLLDHVNPYTGTALKDEPAILFVEMINEPWHHADDVPGSVKYIDALAEAVRGAGGAAARKILFHNVSQDFRIAESIRRSTVPGATFGWYPSGLNSGHELHGASYLRTVDDYPGMRLPALAGHPRLVYEFDSADLLTGYMYPAMVRAFRTGGVQFAAMFAYDMLATASRNLGWQTHYLNLVYTPRKAMSAVIAAEAMRRLPRGRSYGAYPQNTRFGDFRVDAEENLGELVAADAFLNAGPTRSAPPRPARLTRVAGYGSSPVVTYEGEGVYFLDKVRDGVWRLEVYPDAVPVRDPFEMQSPDKVVTRAVYRAWPMTLALPDLGASFAVTPLTGGEGAATVTAQGGRFTVRPGVYVLGARGPVDRASLPKTLGALGFDEFHAPPPDVAPLAVTPALAPEYVAGRPIEIAARVADGTAPNAVTLWVRTAGAGRFRPFPMRASGGYDYRATVPADAMREGVYDVAITVARGDSAVTFPERTRRRPSDWDWSGSTFWRTQVVRPETPLRLLAPADDVPRLAFTRIGDAGRQGIFRVVPSSASGTPAFHLELPLVNGDWSPEDYTAGLSVEDRVRARGDAMDGARGVALRVRGIGPRQTLHVTLVERDGTSWTAAVPLDSTWGERVVPLADFRIGRGVMLPNGFPGSWTYWIAPAAGRGGAGDAVRPRAVERLQLSLRREGNAAPPAGTYGVEVESVALLFR